MRNLAMFLATDAALNHILRDYARDNNLSQYDIAYFRQDEILMPFHMLRARIRNA